MMQKNSLLACPCGSGNKYAQCCGNYISGQSLPETAEALMRSRYTAYTQANINYIQATMREKASENYDPLVAEKWAKLAKWKRLKVKNVLPQTNTQCYVEFIAYYILAGKLQKLHEMSEFKKIDGKWYYVDRLRNIA